MKDQPEEHIEEIPEASPGEAIVEEEEEEEEKEEKEAVTTTTIITIATKGETTEKIYSLAGMS